MPKGNISAKQVERQAIVKEYALYDSKTEYISRDSDPLPQMTRKAIEITLSIGRTPLTSSLIRNF